MDRVPGGPDREGAFTALYEAAYADLVRFVQRRTHPDQADDVVAEVFLVVWRRLDDAPARRDDARAWVFGIARNTLMSQHRGEQRRRALAVRLADTTVDTWTDADVVLTERRVDLSRAWERLSDVHQEALGLAVFDELTAPQAAAVLGISPVAFRLRLSRARRALRLHLEHLPQRCGAATGAPERRTAP